VLGRMDEHTGTLRWVITTEVSFPLTEIEVCPEPEMALNAYSVHAYKRLQLSESTKSAYRLDRVGLLVRRWLGICDYRVKI